MQRYRLAEAGSPAFTPQPDGVVDPTQWTQRGWDMWVDFTTGALYDNASGSPITPDAAVAWAATPQGTGLDFAASGATVKVDTAKFAAPTRYTVAILFQVGTVQSESLSTWVQSTDASVYDRQFRIRSDGKLEWYPWSAPAQPKSSVALTSGQMVHAVITFDGSAQRLYINGILDDTVTTTVSGYNGYTSAIVRFGYNAASGGVGRTSKLLTFGVSLTAYDAGQVLELYQRPFGLGTPQRRARASSSTPATASPGPGTLTLAGQAPTATAGATASPGAGGVAIVGQAPTATAGATAAPGAGQVTLAGIAPTAVAGATASPGAGLITLAGYAPTVTAGALASPGAGAIAIQGRAPTATASGPIDAAPDPIATSGIAWTGQRRRVTWDGEARRVPWTGRPRVVTWQRD